MTNNNYPNSKTLIFSALKGNDISSSTKEFRKKFIINVLACYSGIKGKINFLQFQRFSEEYEQDLKIAFVSGCIPKNASRVFDRSGCVQAVWPVTADCPLACGEFVCKEWIVRLKNCIICV